MSNANKRLERAMVGLIAGCVLMLNGLVLHLIDVLR